MKYALVALLLLVQSGVALAQDRSVQAGWHPGFTRLVIPVPEGSDWQVMRRDGGYRVMVDGATDIGLNGIFDLIPAERVSNVNADADALLVDVACECHADAFLFRPTLLVVDIRDGLPPIDSPFEAVWTEDTILPPLVIDLQTAQNDAESDWLEEISPLNQLPDEPLAEVSALADAIAANLQRGIEQGIIDPIQPMDETGEEPVEVGPAPLEKEAIRTEPSTAAALGLEARTSVDIGLNLGALGIQPNQRSQSCWPDSYADVTRWANGDGFHSDLTVLRSALYSELDRPDVAAFTALAQGYIYYGFGAEAQAVIKGSPEMTSKLKALSQIAALLDAPASLDTALAEQIGCTGTVGVWALLSDDSQSVNPDVDVNAIVRQFRSFPDDLRSHLTPRMARRLVEVGAADAAAFLLESDSIQPSNPVETALAAADIATADGNPDAAIAVLDAAAQTPGRTTPSALLKLVDLTVSQGQRVDDALLEDLEAALFENRDQPVGTDLLDGLVDALLHEDQFVRALSTIDRFSGSIPSPVLSRLEGLVQNAVAARASDLLFLELAFSDALLEAIPPIQNAYADRLLVLGFPDRALAILTGSAQGSEMAERRYLRARAYIESGQAELAERELAGLSTPQAASILGQAQALDNSDVLSGADALEQLTTRVAEDSSASALLEAAGGLVSSTSALDPDSETPLTDSESLISRAAETRQTVEALLDRFDLDSVPQDE